MKNNVFAMLLLSSISFFSIDICAMQKSIEKSSSPKSNLTLEQLSSHENFPTPEHSPSPKNSVTLEQSTTFQQKNDVTTPPTSPVVQSGKLQRFCLMVNRIPFVNKLTKKRVFTALAVIVPVLVAYQVSPELCSLECVTDSWNYFVSCIQSLDLGSYGSWLISSVAGMFGFASNEVSYNVTANSSCASRFSWLYSNGTEICVPLP